MFVPMILVIVGRKVGVTQYTQNPRQNITDAWAMVTDNGPLTVTGTQTNVTPRLVHVDSMW